MAGPTIRRRQLGIELQRLRDAAGVTRAEAATAIGCSPARIGHIELGRNVLNKAELIVLVRDRYQAGPQILATLEDLRQEASRRGWWSTYGLPEWLAAYVGLEYDAISVRSVELELIPGLLQTEQYARELHLLRGHLKPAEVDRRVAMRLRRQDRLTGPDPLRHSVVISEAALLRCARQPGVAEAQFRQLIDRARWPNIDVRVIPIDAGLHIGMAGAFSLLSFPDGLLSDAAHEEHALGGHIIDDESAVSQFATLFAELHGQAPDADESLAIIAKHAHYTR